MARRNTVTGDSQPTTTTRRTRTATGARPRRAAAPVHADGAVAAAPRREPTVEEIRRRAYEIYLERRGVGGSPEADWLQAERELRAR